MMMRYKEFLLIEMALFIYFNSLTYILSIGSESVHFFIYIIHT